MELKLKNVRLAFPKLWRAEQVNGEGKPAFSAAFLIQPTDPQIAEIGRVMKAVAKEKWGEAKWETMYNQLKATDKLCLHNGDTKPNIEGYPGNYFINGRNGVKPLVIDANKAPLSESDGKPYGGCYVNCVLELWAQENKFGKRINATLSGVQFARNGDAFAGGQAADESAFDDISDTGGDAPAAAPKATADLF